MVSGLATQNRIATKTMVNQTHLAMPIIQPRNNSFWDGISTSHFSVAIAR
jgi:hypothetical protein